MLLTVDKAVSLQNCAFQGGTVAIKDLTVQFAGGKNAYTTFNGTNLLVAGNNGALIANSAISVTGSTFIFNDASSFKTNYQVDLSASRINVYDNSTMLSAGSDGSSVNLSNSSQIVIGSGIRTSTASFAVSGSAFNINVYDNSSIVLGNQNNAYSNSSKYNAASSLTTCTGTDAAPHADAVYLYLTTNASAGSGGQTFIQPTSTSSTSGLNLTAPLVISGSAKSKFIVNATGKVSGSDTTCGMNPPVFGFKPVP